MKTRTISGFTLVLILILSLCINKYLFPILMVICSVLATYEIIQIRNDKLDIKIKLLSYILTILLVSNHIFYNLNIIIPILLSILLLTIPVVLYNNKDKYSIEDAFYLISSLLLIGLSFNYLSLFRIERISLCIYVFIISFITDTYAYLGGYFIGSHKLTSISPKKTVEGSIIGSMMATMIGAIFLHLIVGGYNIIISITLSLILSIISQVGDLMFSSIKRYYNKKDYSKLIPGHGGILDRFDSIIYVSLTLGLILELL